MTIVIRALCASLALALCAVRPAHAQGESRGSIEGTVTDSVHARPLAGARVVAVGTDSSSSVRRATISDSAGRYRIDSLAPGRYVVGIESPLLDSLEIALSPREALVGAGRPAIVELALPPAAKLRSALCAGVALPPETGVLFGHVVSAETEGPLAGAEIVLAWHDIEVQKKKRLRAISQVRSASVVTDQSGWYRVCGVPTGAWLTMQIQRDGRSGPVLRARVDDTLGIAIRYLSVAPGAMRANAAEAERAFDAPLSGTASLRGVVRSTDGVPVASAEVRLRGTQAVVRTDTVGAFRLSGLPAGTQGLEVRHVGFAIVEMPVELRSDAAATISVLMRRVVNLDSVVVVASRPKYPDFYLHQKIGWGRFIGPEQIAKERVARTSDIVAKIPGFVVRQSGYRTIVSSARGGALRPCPATIVLNGWRIPGDEPLSVDMLHPSEVGAIEAYPAGQEFLAPAEYRIGGCGGIVIWTKR